MPENIISYEMGWLDSKLVPSINKFDFRYAYLIDEKRETQIELIAQNLLEEFEDYDPKTSTRGRFS